MRISKKRPYFKVCPGCGANLDPGEVCDCVKGAVSMTIPFDKAGLEKALEALQALWAKVPGINRDEVERQLVGATILGIYPLTSVTSKGKPYLTGFSLAIRPLDSRKVITVDIDSALGGDYEDDIGITIADEYVEPEETAII